MTDTPATSCASQQSGAVVRESRTQCNGPCQHLRRVADSRTTASRRFTPQRRGLVLALVMGLSAIVAITGTSVLMSSSSALPAARNYEAAAQARQLAASGAALATHFLRVPPTTIAAGNHWTGASNFSISGSSTALLNVTVTRSLVIPQNFIMSAAGTVRDTDSSIRATSSVSTELVTPPPFTWNLTRAWTAATTPTTSPYVTFTGSVHVNGDVTSAARCTGAVSATGTASWTSVPAPASIASGAASVTMPDLDINEWSRYVVHGSVYEAQTTSNATLNLLGITLMGGRSGLQVIYVGSSSAVVIDPLAVLLGGAGGLGPAITVLSSPLGITGTSRSGLSVVSLTNPGGILIFSGNVDLVGGTNFVGTLATRGRLRITGTGTTSICAMPGYPALVLADDLDIPDGATVEVFGPVLIGDRFTGSAARLTVHGPVLSYSTGFDNNFARTGSAEFRAESDFANLYDFSVDAVQPMTFVKWSE